MRNTEPKQKKDIKEEGKYRGPAPFITGGLIACIPVAGLIALLCIRHKAEDKELRSYCEALLYLRPVVFMITISIYIFIMMMFISRSGI